MAFPPVRPPESLSTTSMMEEAGQKLKRVRERLNLRFRDVEEASAKVAALHGNDEYIVALSRLADIENRGTVPSVYRLYSLCAIYRLDFQEVLSWYGISLGGLPADAALFDHQRTHLLSFKGQEGQVQVPIVLDPGVDVTRTLLLSRLIQRWGTVPLLLLGNLDLRDFRYGLIGSDDWSMYPIIPPGSLVLIDDTKRKIEAGYWPNEFERPIYFLEHRDGWMCRWCTFKEDRLSVQCHPSSNNEPESYLYPGEVEVLGQVTGVAASLEMGARRRDRS